MQIYVKQFDGTKKDYEMEPDQTIIDLKEKIKEVTGTQTHAYTVIHKGKSLKDDQNIEEYGV